MGVVVLGALANVLFHHITMVVLGMGVYGAGLALSLTGIFMLLVLVISTWVFRCVHDTTLHKTPHWMALSVASGGLSFAKSGQIKALLPLEETLT